VKKFYSYLKDYLLNSYSPLKYTLFFVFTGLLITVNFILNFEDDYVDLYNGQNIRILWYALLQGLPYLFCLLLITGKKEKFWTDPIFWLKFFFGFAVLGFDRSFFYHQELTKNLPYEVMIFAYRTMSSLSGLFINVLPLFIFYLIVDRRKRLNRFYGLTIKDVDYKAYGILLFLMIPLVFAASFLPEFIEYYPKYKRVFGPSFASYYSISDWVPIIIYVFAYLSDFISIEMFFRGFLILGMAPHLGKHVVLPMACSYAVLHFGKPMGECISSVFGGYILGVIALYSRNIWGGIVLHMGVAALMELAAFLQIYFRN
jgi:hypothetical protein